MPLSVVNHSPLDEKHFPQMKADQGYLVKLSPLTQILTLSLKSHFDYFNFNYGKLRFQLSTEII